MGIARLWAALAAATSALAALTPLPVSAAPAAPSIIHAGTLLSVPGQVPLSKATVVVQDGMVKDIRPGYLDAASLSLPADTKIVNLENQFVMPGFLDLHVHLSSFSDRGGRDMTLRKPEAYFSLVAYKAATQTLMGGFTTVRDLGSTGYTIFALRDAIADGIVTGPRIIASGDPISPTNGHADNHGLRQEIMDALPRAGICDGADDCRKVVRAAIKRGADVIKVMASGGTLDASNSGTGQQFTDEELKAIADTAHALGRKVTAHAHAKEAIDACIRANFDSIEHGMWADEATLRTMKAKGIWLVPTVATITFVGDTPEKLMAGPLKDLPPVSMAKVLKLGTQPRKLVNLAHRVGTQVALGTDAPLVPHGQNAYEMVDYVGQGFTPMEALMTGTVNAATAAGLADTVGKLAPGMAADIIAMDKSPLDDIHAVLNVGFVMRAGAVVKGDK
ncbi:MAG: amidohydrolase family protein [Gammaproteobacteria bacterium]